MKQENLKNTSKNKLPLSISRNPSWKPHPCPETLTKFSSPSLTTYSIGCFSLRLPASQARVVLPQKQPGRPHQHKLTEHWMWVSRAGVLILFLGGLAHASRQLSFLCISVNSFRSKLKSQVTCGRGSLIKRHNGKHLGLCKYLVLG